MEQYVMSIAGLDPSSGAGLTADVKTFEANGVYGFGVCSALTVQTDDRFYSVEWLPAGKIVAQAAPLLEKFPVAYCKIGIMQSIGAVQKVISALKVIRPDIRFILDPVIKASAGYKLYNDAGLQQWLEVLQDVYLLTPNYQEALAITGLEDGEQAASMLSEYTSVLLKGGHHPNKPCIDQLFVQGTVTEFTAGSISTYPKHGSGCVLSAAITAQLALGEVLESACSKAKAYTYQFLQSSSSLLGKHLR